MKTIFVSSTFRDMDLERDAIQQTVYPMLNKEARQYSQNVSFCDLRWGIDTSLLESESGARKVLDVCLDEIDRCQPPMVVILGNRYGWIPSEDLIKSTANRYSLELDDLEKSVTALEIEYGALADSRKLEHTLFYFREIQGNPPADYLPEDDDHHARLQALKERIRRLTGGRVRHYTLHWEDGALRGVESFADMLYRDLLELLLPQWKDHNDMSPNEKELLIHRNYQQEKAGAFRARKALAEQILTDMDAGRKLTILKGAVGSGKSTLLSHIAQQLELRGWDTLPLFSNLTTQSSTALDLLQLMVEYLENTLRQEHIAQTYHRERNLDSAQIEGFRAFADTDTSQSDTIDVKQWQQRLDQLCALYAKTGRKLVFLIDAIDQLYEDDLRSDLIFIPQALGPNIRFVMTCLPEINCKDLEYTMIPAISQQDKAEVIKGILISHGRELSPMVAEAMTALPASDNPLYLSFLVQRLLMMNKTDFDAIRSHGDGMNAIIRHQISVLSACPHTLDAMSAELMDTAAKRVGGRMVSSALNYLALAQHGLRTSDLADLLGEAFNMLDFAHFISYMNDCFVIRSDGRYDFSHKSIREGLLRRCADPQNGHRRLLDHFTALDPQDEVRKQEIVYHCIQADDKRFFVEYIQEFSWEDKLALSSAAKSTFNASLLDDGNWLCEVLDNGEDLGADRYLLTFIYKHYDRLSSARIRELPTHLRVLTANRMLGERMVKTRKSRYHWSALGYCLEALADCYEALGKENNIQTAQSLRQRQLEIGKVVHQACADVRSKRFLARAHQNLAANMELSIHEDATKTLQHLNTALELRQQLAEETGKDQDQEDLAKLYLKLGKKLSGWFFADTQLALSHTEKALRIYQNLYEATGNIAYLTLQASAYEVSDRAHMREGDNEQALEHCHKQVEILEKVQLQEKTIPVRQQLAAAYMSACTRVSLEEAAKRIRFANRAIALYRGIAQERGSVQDMRNLSQALMDAATEISAFSSADKRAMLQESISIREDLFRELGLESDKDTLAKLYHSLSYYEEDPAVSEDCHSKAKALGYVYKGNAYSEVLELLRHMDREYVDMIPKELIMFLYDKCNLEYDYRLNVPLSEANLSNDTLRILHILNECYWKTNTPAMGELMAIRILGK